MSTKRKITVSRARARAFWNQRQKLAKAGGLTGYLLEDSPAAIGQNRFKGEWRQAKGWLKGLGKGRCLDLGCGTGVWLKALAGEFEHVEGWDYAPAMISACRKTVQAAGLRHVTLRCDDITRRKDRRIFDFIFVGGVLMYTPEAELAPLLKSLARLLKPQGLLLLRESTYAGETWERQGLPLRPGLFAGKKPALDYVAVYRSRDEIRRQLEAAGFAVRAIRSNAHYKLSDLSEDWLRRLDWLLGRRLKHSPRLAEGLAKAIHKARYILLYPEYYLRYWKLKNCWFLAQLPRTSSI